ncbi:MAG: hypothetical protein BWY87_01404 [Deltaproteobacteria bacterium ADurb.Bin510]|nr:MAG: hypothetical protein BWY87_01404 [Deltaproteobacteria bacterium ADurb.Bin510]
MAPPRASSSPVLNTWYSEWIAILASLNIGPSPRTENPGPSPSLTVMDPLLTMVPKLSISIEPPLPAISSMPSPPLASILPASSMPSKASSSTLPALLVDMILGSSVSSASTSSSGPATVIRLAAPVWMWPPLHSSRLGIWQEGPTLLWSSSASSFSGQTGLMVPLMTTSSLKLSSTLLQRLTSIERVTPG